MASSPEGSAPPPPAHRLRLGLRGRLFLLCLTLTAAAGVVTVLYLRPDLRRWQQRRVETELVRLARLAADVVAAAPEPTDALADHLGATVEMRVTLVAEGGQVVGDSNVSVADLGRTENHAQRPEIQAAMARGTGTARRRSATLQRDMVYGAARVGSAADARGVVRVAVPASRIGDRIGDLWAVLSAAGLAGLLAAVVLTSLASHLFSRAFRGAMARLQAMVERGDRDVALDTDAELGPLASSVRGMTMELRATVARLDDERSRMLAVLEGMDDAVIATDDRGSVTLANSAARALLTGDDSPVGRSLIDLIRAPSLHALIDRVAAGLHDSAELDLPGPPERHLLARGAPQRAGGAVVVLQDMTRVRRLEQMRREFVANVSHELRTPVSVIRANAETLLDGAMHEPEVAQGFLDALLRNADRLSALVADLLDLARVESGRFPIERRRMSPSVPLGRAVAALEQTAQNAGLTLRVDVPARLESYADPKALEQVLVNLLHNAIKHSPAGTVVTVTAATLDDARVRLLVDDQGSGIPEAARSRIFERFYRVDEGRSRGVGGTGLGLAIARHLARAMGGDVGVGDAPDGSGGARFWVDLPRFRSVFEGVPLEEPMPRRAQIQGTSGADFTEDPQVQELRRRLLLMAGRVEEMIAHAVRAVVRRDVELARQTIVADRNVNLDEIETDELCLRLLSDRPSSAADLRFITRASKMVTDLERIADLAVNICERVERLEGTPRLSQRDSIPQMAIIVQSMVRDVIDAFVGRDAKMAQAVIERDDQVDALFHELSRQVVALMGREPELVESGIHLQAVAKFLERMADHATNLAEQVVFMVRGDEIRHPGKLVAPSGRDDVERG